MLEIMLMLSLLQSNICICLGKLMDFFCVKECPTRSSTTFFPLWQLQNYHLCFFKIIMLVLLKGIFSQHHHCFKFCSQSFHHKSRHPLLGLIPAWARRCCARASTAGSKWQQQFLPEDEQCLVHGN